MNVFEAVKQAVTARQAAEYYGVRVGRNSMACCPFHNDRTPSMKLDDRFHCFGCGADGDAIDFVELFYGLEKLDSAIKLAEDFGLNYEKGSDKKLPGPKIEDQEQIRHSISEMNFEKKFEQFKLKFIQILMEYISLLRKWKYVYAPDRDDANWHPLFYEALYELPYTVYLLDVLVSEEVEEQATLIVEHGKKVMELEQRIRIFNSNDETESIRSDDGIGTGAFSGRDSRAIAKDTERQC